MKIPKFRRKSRKGQPDDGFSVTPLGNDEQSSVVPSDVSSDPSAEVPITGHLASIDDVANLQPPFSALRVEWSGTAAAVTACVAELAGNQYAVFAKRGQLSSDIFRAVLSRAQKAARKEAVPVYTVEPVVLLTLVRERIDASTLAKATQGKSGGWSAVRTGFHDLVTWAVRNGASDLHLHINKTAPLSKVSATIDGIYVTPEHLSMPTDQMLEMARVAWLDIRGGNGTIFDESREQQGRLYEVVDDCGYMLRWGSFVADTGPSITLRLLDLTSKVTAKDMGELGYLPSQIEQFERALQSKGGVIALGGVPGSGKTVTQAQLIVRLPPTRKVMSIEDPVELQFDNALQASVSRTLDDSDHDTMLAKLMALKRAAASDILIGEVRDTLTGLALQDIILAGSNAYTTTHVGSAAAIPGKFASEMIGIPRSLLASPRMLKLLCYQTLMPVLCNCALPAKSLLEGGVDSIGIWRDGQWWQRYLAHIEYLYDIDAERIRVRNPQGCAHCRQKGIPELYGYNGRTVVAEIFEPGQSLDALQAIAQGDELRLHQIFKSMRTAAFDDPNMNGKSAMHCAVYKMSQGILDPRDIEPHFVAFASVKQEDL